MSDDLTVWSFWKWAWENRAELVKKIADVRRWFSRRKTEPDAPGILVFGAAGTGKSTFARFLSDDNEFYLEPPGAYLESIGIERYRWEDAPGVEVVVPPGQRHRRQSTWTELLADISAGKYFGVVNLNAFGYHAVSTQSAKEHVLYRGNRDEFL